LATVITYIKPSHNLDTFTACLQNAQKSKYLDKFFISFKEKISEEFINQLNKYDNVFWKDEVDNFWATEIKKMILENPDEYYYLWEEDSHIFDIAQFDTTYEKFISTDVDFLFTQDLKWIKRSEHLLDANLVLDEGDFRFFYWGARYAEHCRKTSTDSLVNGAYPVTIAGIFRAKLIVELLDTFMNSKHWKEITSGNFTHFHHNPQLPHSFEVFPEFWWEDKGGSGNLEYKAMVCKKQFAEELGERLVTKL
jgi:hypothetical protein